MANLTNNEENFCQEIVKGCSQIEAHRLAYNKGKYTDKQRYEEASKILKKPKIVQRIEELKKPLQEKFEYSVKQSFDKITEIQNLALVKEDLTNALKSEEMKGKLLNLYVSDKTTPNIVINNNSSLDFDKLKELKDKMK